MSFVPALNSRDLRGHRSGRLVALEPVGRGSEGRILWKCLCDCGGVKVVPGANLTKAAGTRSCGCLVREANARRAKECGPWNIGKTYAIQNGERVYSQKQNWSKAVIRAKGNRCEVCGWNAARCDVHHRVPRSKGGLNTINNGRVLCPNCHRIAHEREGAACG